MAEKTKRKSMTTDTTSKISENPKKKKQVGHSDEGKATVSEDTVWIYGKFGPAITVYHH